MRDVLVLVLVESEKLVTEMENTSSGGNKFGKTQQQVCMSLMILEYEHNSKFNFISFTFCLCRHLKLNLLKFTTILHYKL